MSSRLRSALSFYLIFALAIPPQVWAETLQAVETQKAVPAKKAEPATFSDESVAKPKVLEGTPLLKAETRRDKLRFQFHAGSRFIESVVRQRTPGLISLRGVDYHVILRPYAHCPVDKKRVGQDGAALIEDIDAKVLVPLQKELAAFFAEKGETLVNLSGFEPEEGLQSPSVDVLSGEGDVCIPLVWDAEDSDPTTQLGTASNEKNLNAAVKVRKRLETTQAQGLEYLQPWFLELSRKRADNLPLTNAEARRWMAWLKALRDFRGVLASQLGVTKAMPEMVLAPGPATRVAANNKRVEEMRAVELLDAGQMMNATQLSEELPRFVSCSEKKKACGAEPTGSYESGTLCFCDGGTKAGTRVEEKIFQSLHPTLTPEGKSTPAAMGAYLNAERLLAIQALMMELATVASLLPSQVRPENMADLLPQACRASDDLRDHVRVFENYSTIRFREWWLQRLNTATTEFSDAVRLGKQAVAVPQNPKFYAKANALMKEWVKAVIVAPPAPEVAMGGPANGESAKVAPPTPSAPQTSPTPTEAGDEVPPPAEGTPTPEVTPPLESAPAQAPVAEATKPPVAESSPAPEVDAATPEAMPEDAATETVPADAAPMEGDVSQTAPEEKPLSAQEQMLQMVETFPFEERLLDGTERSALGNGRNFSQELGRLITLWGALIPWEFEKLSDAQFARRDSLVAEMMREAYEAALVNVFMGYAASFFQGDPATFQKAMSEWEKRFRLQWQQLVASTRADTPFRQEVTAISGRLSQELLAMPAFQQKFDADRMADDALTGYVGLVGPRAKEAFVANQIEEFMESHRQNLTNPIAGPSNLIPGGFWNPNNYYYRAAQARNVTDAPACFQVEDGNGHDKQWYELFIASLRPGNPLDYLHLKKALQGMAVSYRQSLIQRITKLLLKTESQVDQATAEWVLAQYPKRSGKGRTANARAVDLLANLPDADVTLASEHQASLVAGKYFKGGANVGSIADIVIEKFFETLEAKDGKDRGRTRAARQAAFARLQSWLAQSVSRDQFADLRRDAAVRIYDYHLRVLLESRTKENAAAVDAQLTERLKELGEQKVLLDSDALVAKLPILIAAQDRYKAAMAAGESRNAIHEFWRKSALEDKVFDNWAENCAKDPAKCQAWFDRASKVFEEPSLDSYFNRRAQSVAKAFLPPFLGAYGAGRKMYSGKPSKANEVLLDRVSRRLLQGWIGFIPEEVDAEKKPIPVAQYDAAKPWIQNFLMEMSKAAQAEGGNDLVLEELPAHVSALVVQHNLFAEWTARIQAQRTQIAAAIASQNPEALKKIQPLVLQTFFSEVQELVNGSNELTPENLRVELISEVAQALLPTFTRLREELNGAMGELLKGEADPMETLRTAELRLTELKDLEWEQTDKKIKNTDPHKTLETEIAFLEKQAIPKAKAQIHREMVFGRLVKTYLPEDLSSALTAGSASNLWLSFLQRQFLDTLQDARGEAMPFSMSQLLADLNAVARKVEAPLEIDAEVAKKFVAETKEYLAGWLSSDALKASFDSAVAQTLSRDRGVLVDIESRDAELWGTLMNALKSPPDSADLARLKLATQKHELRPVYESLFRLHRAWFMAAGNVDGFTDWVAQSTEQVTRNARLPLHMAGLANLAASEDAEAWRIITHAAESGVDSDAFQQLAKLGTLGENAQKAIQDLHRQWVQLKGSADGFGDWFAGLTDGSATFDAIKDNAPMGQGFPAGSRYAQALVEQATALSGELEKIAKPKEGDKPVLLTAELRQRYTAFARLASDLLYHPASQLGPLVVATDKIIWPQVPPTADLAISVRATENGYELSNRGVDERFLTQSILDVLARPKMDKAAFSQIVSPFALRPLGVEIPELKTTEEKIAWVNSLSIVARMAIFNSLQQMIQTKMILSPAINPALVAAFEPEGQPTILNHQDWLNQFARELGVWARFRASFSLANPPAPAEGEPAAPIAGLDGVALSLVRSFTDYTPYRLVDGKRWEVIGSAALAQGKLSDQADTLAAFAKHLRTDRRRAFEQVEDILRIFRRELNENKAEAESEFFLKTVLKLQGVDAAKLPFHGLFAAPETLEQLTPLEVAARVYSRRFGPDALEEKNNNQVLLNQWRSQYALRTLAGTDPFDRLFVGYQPIWIQGTPSESRKHFEEWVQRLQANTETEKAYAAVKAEAPGLTKRAVEEYPTFKALVESPAYKQVLGVMTVADSNSRYKAQEETYPYFLVLLDWNLTEHASPLKPGAATVLPFDDSMRVRFMGELVDVLGLDRKAFSGWESLLKRKGQHEHFAAMARSKKNGLVGVDDNRFLSTGIAGEWTGRSWLGGTENYQPIPVVSDSERSRLQMESAEGSKVGDFALYAQKLQGAEAQAMTRMNQDGEVKRPLYQNLLSLQAQMFAEKDVQEAQARAAKLLDPENVRLAKQRGRANAPEVEFGGKNVIDPRRAELVQGVLKLKGTFPVPTIDELQKVSQLREPFVDFRRTLGEVQSAGQAVQLLTRYLRQIDPKLTDKQAQAIGKSVAPKLGGIDGTTHDKPVLGQVRERALFVASEYTHRKTFGGQSKEDQDRTAAILSTMDEVYRREMQKFEVKDALGTVVKNNQDYLTKLCAPETAAALENVRSKEDLEKVEKLLKDTALAYSTGIHKYLYFDSGLVDDGTGNETRRRVDGVVRKLSTYRQTMETTGHYVNWAVGIGLFAFLFSKPFPGVGSLGRASMRSSVGRFGMIAATSLIAGYFAWQAADDIFNPERLWAGDEMEVLRKVAETQFAGYRPLRRDKDVGTLDDQRIHDRVEATTNVPTLKWAWRLWLLSLTYTMLSPYLRAATGGVRYAWYTRGRFAFGQTPAYANRELAYQAARLGLDAKVVLEASPAEAKQMILEAQTRLAIQRTGAEKGKAIKGAPEMAEEIFPTVDSARVMRKGINAEIEALSAQNYLDPVTGRALRIPEPRKPGFWGWVESKVTVPSWVKNPVGKTLQKANLGNREAQMAAEERVKFLKQLKGKLDGNAPHFNTDDINRWLGAGMDARFANTPTWVFLSGVPFYRNEVISLVGNLQKVAGHAQAAQRMLAVRWMLKWRMDKAGLDVFRRVAQSLNCDPIELLDALHMRGHKYRSIFSVQVDGELAGAIATFEKQQGLREELIASAEELIRAMELGGWRPDHRMFQMLLERSSVQGDRELVRRLISDQHSIALRVSGTQRAPKEGVADDELGFEGEIKVELPEGTPNFLDDVADAWAEPTVKKSTAPNTRGTILPPTARTQDEVIAYLEKQMAKERLGQGLAEPANMQDRKWILEQMRRLDPKAAAVVEHNGILWHEFTADDISGVAAHLRTLGQMSPARESAYQTASGYLKAFEMFGRSADFEVAARVYTEALKYAGTERPMQTAAQVYEILYGQLPSGDDFARTLRRMQTLAGDLGSAPVAPEMAEKNFRSLEKLVQSLRATSAAPERHAEALSRLNEARQLFAKMSQVDDLEVAISRAQTFSKALSHSPQDRALAAKANAAADSQTPTALRRKVYDLLETGMHSETLEAAMVSARRNPKIWNAELAEVFKFAMAYTRAVEVAGSDAARVNMASRIYIELLDLAGADVRVANEMFSGLFGRRVIRRYDRIFNTLGLSYGSDLKTINERIDLLTQKLQALKAHPEFSAVATDANAGLSKLVELKDLARFDGGSDFGFKAAWQAMAADAESAAVIGRLETEVLGADLTSQQVLDRLARVRAKLIAEVAAGTQPVTAIDAMSRASTTIRAKLMLKLMQADGVKSAEALETTAQALMEFSRTAKLRFPMSPEESEAFIVAEWEHQFGISIDPAALRKAENLEKLHAAAKENKMKTERWTPFLRAIDALHTNLPRTTSLDRSWLRMEDPLGLPWEIVTHPEVVKDPGLFHYLAGGDDASTEGVAALRLLMMENPEAELLDSAMKRLYRSHEQHLAAFERENRARQASGLPPVMEQNQGPSALQDIYMGLKMREQWATEAANAPELIQLERAMNRLTGEKPIPQPAVPEAPEIIEGGGTAGPSLSPQ